MGSMPQYTCFARTALLTNAQGVAIMVAIKQYLIQLEPSFVERVLSRPRSQRPRGFFGPSIHFGNSTPGHAYL